MREELAKVGEKTAGILTAAEEAARNLRDEAAEYAERLRADADDEARKARLNASQKMDEMIADAEAKAQGIIDDAIARRRQLNQAISSLVDRRDEIAADATRLAEELLAAVEGLRTAAAPLTSPAEPESDEVLVEEPRVRRGRRRASPTPRRRRSTSLIRRRPRFTSSRRPFWSTPTPRTRRLHRARLGSPQHLGRGALA